MEYRNNWALLTPTVSCLRHLEMAKSVSKYNFSPTDLITCTQLAE